MVVPTPAELRLLPRRALELWKALVRVRGTAADDDFSDWEWFSIDLHELQVRARISSYASARNALADLKRAGLVATSANYTTRVIKHKTGRLESVNARVQNNYLVAGDYKIRSGIEKFRFPARAWNEYVTARKNCKLHDVLIVAPRKSDDEPVSKEVAACLRGFPRSGKGLRPKVVTSLFKQTLRVCSSNSYELEEARSASFLSKERSEIDWLGVLEDERRKIPARGDGSCPHKPIDLLVRRSHAQQYPDLDKTEDPLREITRAYNEAARRIFGRDPHLYARTTDMAKAKGAAALKAAADACYDHGVNPLYWALWRMTYLRDKRGQKKAPPLFVIMSAKAIHRMAGWFRKDFEHPQDAEILDEVRVEQMLRNREAARRWRGFTERGALLALPAWYAQKRREEIERGHDNPHDLWPTRNVA